MKKITCEIAILQDSKYTKERFKQTQLKNINDTTPGKRLQRCKIRENKKLGRSTREKSHAYEVKRGKYDSNGGLQNYNVVLLTEKINLY
ncbi:hypothetical protein HZS_7154 [Henneguya salminicola]|nr:hypothetical protein HZS_7154 [Henneguya salminicola]